MTSHVERLRELYAKHELDVSRQFGARQTRAIAAQDAASLLAANQARLFSTEFTGPNPITTAAAGDEESALHIKRHKLQSKLEATPADAAAAAAPPATAGALSLLSDKTETRQDSTMSRAMQVRRMEEAGEEVPAREHANWKLYRVIASHRGTPRSVAVDPSNRVFCTGGMDNVIKVFDLATGKLRVDLSGHTHCVRALAFSPRHAYMFSASEDKQIKCWDLELNQVVRQYHGHTAGVYAMQVHPTLDLVVSAGRDKTVRVWDMRTRANVHVLHGHKDAVVSLGLQSNEPQITSGAEDATVRLWDLTAGGRCLHTLTHHKKGVRALAIHPTEFSFAAAATNAIKKFAYPQGVLMQNFKPSEEVGGSNMGVIRALQIRPGLGELAVSGSDDGSLRFWDWKSGKEVQRLQMRCVPGSLDSERAVTALAFDMTGDRLIACVEDKSIQMFQPVLT